MMVLCYTTGFPYKIMKKAIKVKLSLCLTKHYAMKVYWGMEI
jgi:hypothetical protein